MNWKEKCVKEAGKQSDKKWSLISSACQCEVWPPAPLIQSSEQVLPSLSLRFLMEETRITTMSCEEWLGHRRRLRGGEKRKSTMASMAPLTQALCELLHRKEKLSWTGCTQELEQRTLLFPRHGVQGLPRKSSGCCREWALSEPQHKAWVLVKQGQFCS